MDTPKTAKGLKILIVEDEGDICFLLNLMLKKDNVDIEHVNTLKQADVFLREQKPDLVIMDNKLPDGHGIDHIAGIRNTYPGIKIVMISGHTTTSDKEKAIKNGADMFIGKPFKKEQMQHALEELTSYSFTEA